MIFTAFILGLLGSLHCVGMCGPIAFMLPVDRSNSLKKAWQISLYHLGRLFSYAIIGLVFGLIGKSFYLFGWQQHLSIAVGILMIAVVLLPNRYLNKFNLTKPIYKGVGKIKSSLGKELKKKTPDTFITIGFLNGFLPCGLVYMAVFAAVATASLLQGSLYMVLFGLGTIPLMTSVIYLSRFITGRFRNNIQKIIPVFVLIIGVLFIVRGLGLGIPYLSPVPMVDVVSNNMDCH